MMPLILADTGEEAVIRRVGGSPEMKKHLEDMGFTVGGAVTVLNTIGGNWGKPDREDQGIPGGHQQGDGPKDHGLKNAIKEKQG